MNLSRTLKATLLASLGLAASLHTPLEVISQGLQSTNNVAFNATQPEQIMEGEILIRFNPNVANQQMQDALDRAGGRILKQFRTGAMAQQGHPGLSRVATKLPVAQAIEALKNHPGVLSVEPNYIYRKLESKDGWVIKDRFYGDTQNPLWGMYGGKSGAVPGTTTAPANGFGSQADEAWFAKYTGLDSIFNPVPSPGPAPTDEVVVGVIDEGISWNHPDLIANMGNPLDPVDGKDNDGNGKIDDSYGWDFISEDNSVFDPVAGYPDTDAHGTHVAGTIGARANNSYIAADGTTYENIGVAGVIDNVKMISGKFLGPDGGTSFDAIQAIYYFVDLKARGANVVALNNSWGGGPYSAELHAAIIDAAKANILFIAAAGNGDRFGRAINTDTSPSYPACYDTTKNAVSGSTVLATAASFDSVISVAAIQADGQKATFSNYGANTVDLAAPGHNIVSTYPWQDPKVSGNPYTWDPQNCYMPYNGTSMAAPHVTGAAALYAAHYPNASAAAIKHSILTAARNTPTASMAGKCVTGGRLSLLEIGVAPTEPPAAPAAPATTPVLGSSFVKSKTSLTVYLSWADVADETGYELQRSTSSAFTSGVTTIQKAADSTTHTDSGLKGNGTYYYRLRAKNNAGTTPWSNTVKVP